MILLAGSALLAIALAISIALHPAPSGGHLAYALMLGVHVVALALLRRGVVRGAVIFFAVAYLAVVVIVVVRTGGRIAPIGFVLPPLVIFVGLTSGGRGALATAFASAALV
ncbi:MAG: hypothetical protein F9K40_04555, partial [Kofleriaceae bacterium]